MMRRKAISRRAANGRVLIQSRFGAWGSTARPPHHRICVRFLARRLLLLLPGFRHECIVRRTRTRVGRTHLLRYEYPVHTRTGGDAGSLTMKEMEVVAGGGGVMVVGNWGCSYS